jgi:hypothetical protein
MTHSPPYPKCEHRWRGGGARANCGSDEVFTVTGMGSYNVSKIKDFARLGPHKFIRTVLPIDQRMVDYIWRKNDPDRARLAELTAADIAQRYAIALFTGNKVDGLDETQLIDGNHYILKLWELGFDKYRCLLVPKKMEHFFRIWLEVKIAGEWRRVTEEELLSCTTGKYIRPNADGGWTERRSA